MNLFMTGILYLLFAISLTLSLPATNSQADEKYNLSLKKNVRQSSTGYGGNAERAVDGNTDGNYYANSVSHTNSDKEAWWEVDLGQTQNIREAIIWNRTECCSERLSNFYVLVSERPFTSNSLADALNNNSVLNYQHPGAVGNKVSIPVNASGRYVRVQLQGDNYLSLAEVQIIGSYRPENSAVSGLQPLSPPGDPIIVANGNTAWVQSNPTHATAFGIKAPHLITYMFNYHYYNNGKPPGTIALRGEDGAMYGPWQAVGAAGQGNMPNAYWVVRPNIVLNSGIYAIIDSDPSTWSYNSESKGSGFFEVRGVKQTSQSVSQPALPPIVVNSLPAGFSSQIMVAGTESLISSSPEMKAILSGVVGETLDISQIQVNAANARFLSGSAYVRGTRGVRLNPPKGYASGQNLGGNFYITFPLEESLIQGGTSSNIGVICSTESWTAFVPGILDKKTRTVSVPTNHLSIWTPARKSKSEEMTAFFKQQGLLMAQRAQDWAKDKTGDILLEGVQEFLDKNELDKTTAGKILGSIAKNKESLQQIYEGVSASDVEGAALSTQLLIGKIIAENVPESGMSTLLNGLTKHPDIAADASQAAGSFAGGDYYKTSETIGRIIWKQSPVGKNIDRAIAAETAAWEFLTQNQYEAAYQKYKENGSEGLVSMFGGPAAYVREKFFKGKSASDDEVTKKMEELFETAKRQEEKASVEQAKLEKMYALFQKMENEGGASGMVHDFRLSRERLGKDGESDVFDEFLHLTRRIQRDLLALGVDPWLLGRTFNSSNPNFSTEALALLAAFSREGPAAYKAKLAEIAKTRFPKRAASPCTSEAIKLFEIIIEKPVKKSSEPTGGARK